jgi:hypothetical protein
MMEEREANPSPTAQTSSHVERFWLLLDAFR